MLGVKTYCHIADNRIVLNGLPYYEDQSSLPMKDFLGKAFKQAGIRYPKFYKMDEISKLGFLAAELLIHSVDNDYDGEKVGIVLANSHSTLVTDSKFQDSINDYQDFFPSPAVFVYTLPNIMIGEISIRHKLRGENAFFIFDAFNPGVCTKYVNQLYTSGKIERCLGGWVDQSPDNYEAFLYWAEPFDETGVCVEHNEQEIKKLYRTNKK